jgi:hypothetical protein
VRLRLEARQDCYCVIAPDHPQFGRRQPKIGHAARSYGNGHIRVVATEEDCDIETSFFRAAIAGGFAELAIA